MVGGYSGLYRVSVDATKAIQRADVRRCAALESCRSCDISDGGRVLAAVGFAMRYENYGDTIYLKKVA